MSSRKRFSKSLDCRQSITQCLDHIGRISALMRSTKAMRSIAVCWSVCCSRFADHLQLGDDATVEAMIWKGCYLGMRPLMMSNSSDRATDLSVDAELEQKNPHRRRAGLVCALPP